MTFTGLMPAFVLLAAPAQTTPAPVSSEQAAIPSPPAPSISIAPPPVVTTLPPAPADPVPITVRHPRHAAGDPLEGFNRRMFRAQERFDRKFFRPAALGYKHALPKPVRSGFRNFFSNLGEPIVFLNYVLQFKPGKAVETAARFMVNSTLGIGGVVDLAKSPGVKLPHRQNGLGTTLALYGVKPGPYLFLPFVGPTTLRDLVGGQAEGLVLPLAIGTPFDRLEYQIPKAVITGLDTRAEADGDLKALNAGAVDPYATLRSVYLQNRAGEIDQIRGHHAAAAAIPELGEPLEDPAGARVPATEPQSTSPELSDPLADPEKPTP